PLPADARSADDAWFRVTAGGQYGWAARTVLDVPAPADRLPVYAPQSNPAPMQTFFLRTGAGTPVCAEAPDALIVQGPRGMAVDFTVNGADLRIGSTAVLRTIPLNSPYGARLPPDLANYISGFLEISVLDGEVIIEPESADPLIITANETTSICLDLPQNLGIDGQPNDQPVTDLCGGWEEPGPISDALRQSLRLIDDYPLIYPIPVFDDPTPTPLPPTSTPVPPTDTPVPPTNTPVPPTDTPVPPTDTSVPPTSTPVPPTDTPVPPTDTPVPPTATLEDLSVDISLSVAEIIEPPFRELHAYQVVYEVVNASATLPAYNVVVTDLMPTNSTFSTYAGPGSYSPSTDTLTLGSVAPGTTLSLTIDFIFDSAIAGTTQNSSAALTADNDNTPGNNDAPISFYINSQADLGVTITPSTLSPAVGVPFTVQVDVTNYHPSQTVINIIVPCSVPSGLTINSGGGPWSIPSLGPGVTVTFTLDLTATPPTAGVPQTITVGPPLAPNDDSISANNIASTTVTPF
ncbi:MAG: DUF11 domain-containing protein, partial [Anaerolinea sp.]|nr:DUF11 domain-containing protein [Anaerolinea sp.]